MTQNNGTKKISISIYRMHVKMMNENNLQIQSVFPPIKERNIFKITL